MVLPRYGILLSILVGLYLVLVIPALSKPLQFDEAEDAAFAQQINKNFSAVIEYYGEDIKNEGFQVNRMRLPAKYGYYFHPALFPYTLALAARLFGDFDYVYRGLSLISVILTLILLNWFIWAYCVEPRKAKRVSLIASTVFLFTPLTFYGSHLVDIDNSLLLLFNAAFVFLFSRLYIERKLNLNNLVLLGAIFCLNLLAKDTTPPIIIACIFIYYLINKDLKEGCRVCFLIFFFGVAFFALIWTLYCSIAGISPLLFLRISRALFLERLGVLSLIERVRLLKWSFFWLSAPLVALTLISFWHYFSHWFKARDKKNIILLFIIICSVIFTLYSFILTGMYNIKYIVPVMPFLSFIVAQYLDDKLLSAKNYWKVCAGLSLFLFFYYYIFVKDILLVLWSPEKINISYWLQQPKIISSGLYLLPICIGTMIIFVFLRKKFLIHFSLLCIVVFVAIGLSQGLRQGYSDYSLTYNYGERGTREVITYLQKNTSPKDLLVCRMDIGVRYLNCLYYSDYVLRSPKKIEKLIKDYPIKLIVFSKRSRFLPNKDLEKVFAKYCYIETVIGDFFIYRTNKNT